MKLKTICTAVITFLLLSQSSSAQVNKGDFMAGINFSAKGMQLLDTAKGNVSRTIRPGYTPYISYAIRKNTVIGASVTFNTLHNGVLDFSSNSHDIGTSLFIRGYHQWGKKWYGFLQGDISYKSEAGLNYNKEQFNFKSVGLNFSGGIGYRISNKINLELGVNNLFGVDIYRRTKYSSGTSNNSIHFNAADFLRDNGLHIGISFRF